MESMFKSSFRSFLDTSYIDFVEYGNTFIFPDYEFQVQLVPAGADVCENVECEVDLIDVSQIIPGSKVEKEIKETGVIIYEQ